MTLAVRFEHATPKYPMNFAVVALPSGIVKHIVAAGCGVVDYVHSGSHLLAVEFDPATQDIQLGDRMPLPFSVEAFVLVDGGPTTDSIVAGDPLGEAPPIFKFDLETTVGIGTSGTSGKITARSEHLYSPCQYLVKHDGPRGLPAQTWFDEEDLTEIVGG